MGGDEFVLVLPGFEIVDLPEKLLVLEKVVVESGVAVCAERLLNISIGAVFCPENGTDAEGLLAEADRRMYLVKQHRKKVGVPHANDLAKLAARLEHSTVTATHSPVLR
jgi:diguanylate cyclase (GGDEF)-like protein